MLFYVHYFLLQTSRSRRIMDLNWGTIIHAIGNGTQIKEAPTCPHLQGADGAMTRAIWTGTPPFLWVCYNNECSLFKKAGNI